MGYKAPILVAVVTLLATSTAVPTGLKESCASTCSEASKFAYDRGMNYEYDYSINTKTIDFPMDSDDNSEMNIKARATVSVVSPCEFVLTLSNVELQGSSQSSDFNTAVTKAPLRFGFNDGDITDICSDSQEPVWVTNFKRGVLSMFQNTMSSLHEDQTVTDVDIIGVCDTDYTSQNDEITNSIRITKSKTFESCKTLSMGSYTSLPEPLTKLPLVSSRETCNQKIEGGIISEVGCTQYMLLTPISGTGGVSTTVTTTLTLVNSNHGVSIPDFDIIKSTIEFDGSDEMSINARSFYKVESILQEMDEKSRTFIESDIPALFSELVETLRHLDQNQMEILFESNRHSRVWRFLVDAAPMVATPASMAIVSDLVITQQLTDNEADIWFTSLAFIPNPEAEMFTKIPTVLMHHQSKKALLGISALVNSYCKKNPSCMEHNALREVAATIEHRLGSGCRAYSLEEKDNILITLKALGNMGRWTSHEALDSCYLETTNSAEIRVAALEAWRRAPCDYDRSKLMGVYSDNTQDSEIRIAAYLSLMACPTAELIDTIKYRLVAESVNQVGSFVWTHLTNLQESASLDKQWIRELIGEDMLVNKFNTSALRFSRNFESSFYMKELGFGSTVESNVIFSHNSVLPRSGMLNLTLDFFGESLNMLEIGGRIEGFEALIENFFGPNGYYPEETVEAIIKNLRNSNPQETTLEQMLDVATEDEVGSYYVRVLGNDLYYHRFRGIENFFDKSGDFNLFEMIMELARTGQVDYTKTYNLIDTELRYPTVSGLPLTLKVNSTATIGLRMDGKYSMRSFSDIDINGHIYPSASIQSEATMLIDAQVSKYGRKMITNARVSNYLDGKLKISGNKLVDFELNMPHEKTELLDIKSEKVFIEDGVEKPYMERSARDSATTCLNTNLILGAKLCIQPSPITDIPHAMWGINTYIMKTDTHTGYVFKYEKDSDRFALIFDTPGSTINRRMSVEASKVNSAVNVDIQTPWKSISAIGTHELTGGENSYSFSITADGQRTYQMDATYDFTNDETIVRLDSSLKVESFNNVIFNTRFGYERNIAEQSLKVDFNEAGTLFPGSLHWSSRNSESFKSVETEIISEFVNLSGKGVFELSDKISSQIDGKYSLMKRPEETFSHYFKYEKSRETPSVTYVISLVQNMSQLSIMNINSNGKFVMVPGRIETSASIDYPSGNFDIQSNNVVNYNFNEANTKSYDIRMALTSSAMNIDALLTENFRISSNSLLREAYLRLTPQYFIKSKTELGYRGDEEGFAKVHLTIPSLDMAHEFSYTKIAHKYYTGQVLSKVNGAESSIDVSYQDRSVLGQSVDLLMGAKIRVGEVVRDTHLTLQANQQEGITLDAASSSQGVDKFLKFTASRRAFNLESNVVKTLALHGELTLEGETRSAKLTGRWDITDITVSLSLDRSSVAGVLRYGDMVKSFKAEIRTNGILLEMILNPTEVIRAAVDMSFGNNFIFNASLETPYSSFEKQEAIITFNRESARSIGSQINITWRNTQLISLTTSADFETSLEEGNMNIMSSLVCSPDVFGFERFHFIMKHARTGSEVDSSMTGTLDGNEILSGKFVSSFSRNESSLVAELKSPMTREFNANISRIRNQEEVYQISYGEHYMMSDFKITNNLPRDIHYIYSFSSSLTDELKHEMKLIMDEPQSTLTIEGSYGDNKASALFTMNKTASSDSQSMTITARVLVPNMSPIAGSLNVAFSQNRNIVIDMEMTRFWSSYGTLKVHKDIRMISLSNIQCSTTISSPTVRASYDYLFKIENINLNSYLRGTVNGIKIDASAVGTVDIPQKKLNIKSSFMWNDDPMMKLSVDYAKKADTHVTKLKLELANEYYNIHHELEPVSFLNWNNELHVNDIYIKNQMINENQSVKHIFDWNYSDKFVRGELYRGYLPDNKPVLTDHFNVKLSSAWCLDTEVDLILKLDGLRATHAQFIAKYGDDFNLGVESSFNLDHTGLMFNAAFESSFYDTMQLEVSAETRSNGYILFNKGSDSTKIELSGYRINNEQIGRINVNSSYLTNNVEVEFRLLNEDNGKLLRIGVVADRRSSILLSYSKSSRNGALSCELNIPYIDINDAKLNIQYNFNSQPIIVKGLLSVFDKDHSVSISVGESEVAVTVVCGTMNAQMKSSWIINSPLIQFDTSISCFNFFEFELHSMIDRRQKKFTFDSKYNTDNSVTIVIELGNNSIIKADGLVIIASNPIYNISIKLDDSSLTATLSQSDSDINIRGNYNFDPTVGHFTVTIFTPFVNYEEITCEAAYNLETENEFSITLTGHQISFNANLSAGISSVTSPSFRLDITTLLEDYKSVGLSFNYNIEEPIKTCDVKIYRNDNQLAWKIQVESATPGEGQASMEATTPFYGFETLRYGLKYRVSGHSVSVEIYREVNSERFEASLTLEMQSHSLSGTLSTTNEMVKEITFTGQLDSYEAQHTASLDVQINNSNPISILGVIVQDTNSPMFKFEMKSPYTGFTEFEVISELKVAPTEIELVSSVVKESDVYRARLFTKKQYKEGELIFTLSSPIAEYSSVELAGKYNLLSDVKVATVDLERNGLREHFSINAQLNNNHFILLIETPINSFSRITLEGDMTLTGRERSVVAKITHDSVEYSLQGSVNLLLREFNLRTAIPHEEFGNIHLTGRRTPSGYKLTLTKNDVDFEVVADYNIEPRAGMLRLQTPINGLRNIALSYDINMRPGALKTSVTYSREEFEAEIGAKLLYSNLKSSIAMTCKIPAVNTDIAFKSKYDFTEKEKVVEATFKYNDQREKLAMTLQYDSNSAGLHVAVPFIRKVISAEYKFSLDRTSRSIAAVFKGTLDREVYEFTASGQLNSNAIQALITTPFEGVQKIEGTAMIERDEQRAVARAVFGQHEVSLTLIYALNDMLLEIITPFAQMAHIKLSSVTQYTPTLKEINIMGKYNDIDVGLIGKHQPGSIFVELKKSESIITISGEREDKKGQLSVNIFKSETENINFFGKLDLSPNGNALELKLQTARESDLIALNGRFIDNEVELRIQSPVEGFNAFYSRGTLNRSKRSVNFEMVNDSSSSSISASFNSLNIHIKTPYESAREATISIEKTETGGYELHYKRGENFVDISATVTGSGRRKSFQITVNSAFPGWEYLALTGRLDRDELIGYLSGQINEDKMTIEGGGKYSRTTSDLNFTVNTPYEGYETVTASLKFNTRRKQFDLQVRSATSDFRILLSSSPNLTVDIYVPNSAEPTVIDISVSLFNGHVNISSRFAKIRTFSFTYSISIQAAEVEVNAKIEHNGVELFVLEFKRGDGSAHLKIDARRGENHSMIHFHRRLLEEIEFTFNRNGKEFKVEAHSTGNIPTSGTIEAVINNSFREVPRTVTAKLDLDRTGSPKTAKLEITFPGNRLYVFNLSYNISLRNLKVGDYTLSIVTPNRRAYKWQNLEGSWDFTNRNNAQVTFNIGRDQYTANGKFGLLDSDFVVTKGNGNPITFKWHFEKTSTRNERTRDYYLKIGTERSFLMVMLKGTFSGLTRGNAEFGIQTPSMSNEFAMTLNWQRNEQGLSGSGSFNHGGSNGTFTLNRLKRFAETRSAVINFEANTNIPNFSHVTVIGEYSFNNEAVLKLDVVWDTDKVSINFNIHDITAEFTEQTASFTLPGYGDINVTFGHDFRNKRSRKFTATAQIGGQESYIKAEWNRNSAFTRLSGTVEAKSIFLGEININGQYDVRNIHNAKAEIHYTRNSDKFVNIVWSRVYENRELKAELSFESHMELLSVAKIVVNGQFVDQFKLDMTLKLNEREIKMELLVVSGSITGKFTSPIPGFEEINGSLVWNFEDRQEKTATLRYTRGDVQLNMDFSLTMPSRRNGQLALTLTTPFEIVRTLTLDASWKNRRGEVHYKRNDIEYNFTGEAEVKADRTSFEVNFTPTSGEDPIKLSFEFNAGSFISGTGTEPEEVAKVEVMMLGKRIEFELDGFRNQDRIMVHLEAESSFERLTKFDVKLDSELNTRERDGLFEITINEFHFKMRNHFEQKESGGFYFRSEIDSSLTDLPGVIIGFGRDGDDRIITVGLGDDREITVTYAPKENFRAGLSGKLSLPHRGINDAAFDINYNFDGANILNIDSQIELEPGKVIEVDCVYNSDGVRARLSSPRFGKRSIRMRRSISDSSYFVDVGLDDYSITATANRLPLSKGFVIEGRVFGTDVSVNSFLNLEGPSKGEGKFILNTSIPGYKNLGGLFSYEHANNEIHGRAELNLPSYITPKVFMNVNLDMNNRIEGIISLDVSEQIYALRCNLRGNYYDGYTGQIKLTTPFHLVSEITLDGFFKFNGLRFCELVFNVAHPMGSKDITIKYSGVSGEIVFEGKVDTDSSNNVHIKFDLDRKIGKLDIEISVFENLVRFQGELNPMTVKANLLFDTSLLSDPLILDILHIRGQRTEQYEASLTLFKETHNIAVSYVIDRTEVEVTLLIQSSIVSGRQMILFKHSIPRSYRRDNLTAQIVYSGIDTYELQVDVDRSDNFKATARLSCPHGDSKLELIGAIHSRSFRGAIALTTPWTEDKISITLDHNITGRRNGLLDFDFILISSFLESDFQYILKIDCNSEQTLTEQSLRYGTELSMMKGGYSYTSRGVLVQAELNTSLFNIGDVSITGDCRTGDVKRIIVKMTRNSILNTLDMKYDSIEKGIYAIIKSPFIPGGTAKAEVSCDGSSLEDMSIRTSFRLNKNTVDAQMNIAIESLNNMRSTLTVKTPITGFRKLNFGASFITSDVIVASFYADKPLGYKFEFKSGKQNDEYVSEIDIETPIDGFETVSAIVKSSTTKISPSLSLVLPSAEYGFDFVAENEQHSRKLAANVNINSLQYGTGIDFRNKPPYEFGYFAKTQDFHRSFHIMMDSSFFSLFSLAL